MNSACAGALCTCYFRNDLAISFVVSLPHTHCQKKWLLTANICLFSVSLRQLTFTASHSVYCCSEDHAGFFFDIWKGKINYFTLWSQLHYFHGDSLQQVEQYDPKEVISYSMSRVFWFVRFWQWRFPVMLQFASQMMPDLTATCITQFGRHRHSKSQYVT